MFTSDVAFTPSVKAIQAAKGSRRAYANMELNGSWPSKLTNDAREFISSVTSFYMATANSEGQPYIQHRGGPAGFLRILDDSTLGFVDYTGNRQFISSGNLKDNPKAHLFLMDYRNRQRIKIWGEAEIVSDDAQLREQLMPADYRAKPEQVIVFKISAWDVNCPAHIPVRYEASDVKQALDSRDLRIKELEDELRALKSVRT
jgi:predicted pyridoxine 5'-phosphate oxidase superfamily flavin-nucleotide-binding protein